ncbi:unannotated protein [freshwater metagenome]|uniref:Unannotated protein n=1 Tax=freshwater metagenome TaxID=449393 RepID=A0A6J7F6F5_9ZZZZ
MDAVDDAPQVDVEHPLPVIKREVSHATHRSDTGVIDNDVDLAESLNNAVCERLNGCGAGHVYLNARHAKFGGGSGDSRFVHAGDDDGGAGFFQALRNSFANSRRTSGDDCDFSGEVLHHITHAF